MTAIVRRSDYLPDFTEYLAGETVDRGTLVMWKKRRRAGGVTGSTPVCSL